MTADDRRLAIERAAESLIRLSESRADTAAVLARLVAVVADEAARTPRFARALDAAVAPPAVLQAAAPKRPGRRQPGTLDPFAVYAEGGEAGLRARLEELGLEQLRDIIAEHAMDQDRLAMKWKMPSRVIDRIVERVASRTAKGSAFRTQPR